MARLKDVAQLAEVSVTTASSILNIPGGAERFSPECIARVQKAARQLGYAANYHYQALKKGRSEIIGLAVTGPAVFRKHLGWFRSKAIAGLMWACGEHNYEFMVINDNDHATAVARGMEHIRQQRIDGLVVACPVLEQRRQDLVDCDLPVVISRYHFDTKLPCVKADLAGGPALVMDHLLELGHRNIAIYIPDNCQAAASEVGRFDEIHQWQLPQPFADAGVNVSLHESGHWPLRLEQAPYVENACKLTHQLLDAGNGPTAIVCWSEILAQGVYKAASERNLRIPDDLSVAAFSDLYARYHHPPLTVVSYRETDVCHKAAELLLEHLAGDGNFDDLKATTIKIAPALVVRASTAASRNN